MAKDTATVIEALLESVTSNPNLQRRMYSKTFWNDLGLKVRSRARVEAIRLALEHSGLTVTLSEGEFGSEDKDTWLTFALADSSAQPNASKTLEFATAAVGKPAPTNTMRALSIRQPWAELIVRGIKDVENRSWLTHHRGPLLIHASQTKPTREDLDDFGIENPMYGAIIGVVDVVDCKLEISSEWHEPESQGWYLQNPRMFENPIAFKGAVGLLNVSLELVEEALRTASAPSSLDRQFVPRMVFTDDELAIARACPVLLNPSFNARFIKSGSWVEYRFEPSGTKLNAVVDRVESVSTSEMLDQAEAAMEQVYAKFGEDVDFGNPEVFEAVTRTLEPILRRNPEFLAACRLANLEPVDVLASLLALPGESLAVIHRHFVDR
jgi:hypothetical protein